MKKKMSPLFFGGVTLNMIGIILMRLLSDWQHNWIPIPLALLGLVLIIFGAVKSRKE